MTKAQKASRGASPRPSVIRSTRSAAGLSQARAAELVGVTTRAWQYWESGKRNMHVSKWRLFSMILAGGRTAMATREGEAAKQ